MQNHRRSIRLPGADYTQSGAYFITICTHDKACVFGTITLGMMEINAWGLVVKECWDDVPLHFPFVTLNAFVVMPNHVHGIVIISDHTTNMTPLSPISAHDDSRGMIYHIGIKLRQKGEDKVSSRCLSHSGTTISSSEKYKRQSQELQLFLGELGDHLGQSSGFVQRQSRLSGSKLIQILTLGSLENGTTSLRGFCRVAAALGIKISESGLHQRLETGAVELLRQVSQAYLAQKSQGTMKAVFAPFPHVHVVDSTEIRLPDHLNGLFRGRRCAASLKVQLAYEYKQGHIEAIEIEQGCEPDQNSDLGMDVAKSGDLVLFDLGYFDQKRFARLEDKGVFFVSRLHSQVGLYASPDSRQAIKLLEVVRGKGQCGELSYYLGRQQRLAVRVLYYHLPSDVIAERRRKAHEAARKNGTTCSQHSLDSLEWLMTLTLSINSFKMKKRRPMN